MHRSPKISAQLIETGLFSYQIYTHVCQLIGTNFKYNTYYMLWFRLPLPQEQGFPKKVDFEFVLENIPLEIQTQLLFHLDLFR